MKIIQNTDNQVPYKFDTVSHDTLILEKIFLRTTMGSGTEPRILITKQKIYSSTTFSIHDLSY